MCTLIHSIPVCSSVIKVICRGGLLPSLMEDSPDLPCIKKPSVILFDFGDGPSSWHSQHLLKHWQSASYMFRLDLVSSLLINGFLVQTFLLHLRARL